MELYFIAIDYREVKGIEPCRETVFHSRCTANLAMRGGAGSMGADSDMKLEPSSPTEKYTFTRCSSTGSVNTPSSSAHNTGKQLHRVSTDERLQLSV